MDIHRALQRQHVQHGRTADRQPAVRILRSSFARPRSNSKNTLSSRCASFRSHSIRFTPFAAATAAPRKRSTLAPAAPTHTLNVALYGAQPGLKLKVQIASESNPNDVSQQWSIDEPKHAHNHREVDETGGFKCDHTKDIQLAEGFQPGAILVSMEPAGKEAFHIYLSNLQLVEKSTGKAVNYLVNTNMHKDQGTRPFFPDTLTLPAFHMETPEGIAKFRSSELAAFKGTSATPEQRRRQRKGSERIYDFDVYNDLGGTDSNKPELWRPTLGGDTLKYPRRLRTGRKVENGGEKSPDPGDLPWLPMDERFNAIKFKEFTSGKDGASGQSVRALLGTPTGLTFAQSLEGFLKKMLHPFKKEKDEDSFKSQIFHNFSIYETLFKPLSDQDMTDKALQELLPFKALKMDEVLEEMKDIHLDTGLPRAFQLGTDTKAINSAIQETIDEIRNQDAKGSNPVVAASTLSSWGTWGSWLDPTSYRIFGGGTADTEKEDNIKETSANKGTNKFIPNPEFRDVNPSLAPTGFGGVKEKVLSAATVIKGMLEQWPAPQSRMTRALEWRSDENFARTFLAGQNPLSIRAMTEQDLKIFAVRDDDVKGFLEGRTLAEAQSEGRLFTVDYHPGYSDYVEKVAELRKKPKEPFDGVLYAGRCVFYKRNFGPLMPVSIELKTDGDEKLRVYTPDNLSEVWFMAKTVIASLDSGIHQLVSHWLTTHACVEAIAISTRRELSILHPLFKLLQPHFRYTLRINCNARTSLVNSGGIIEKCFSPGRYCMELSSKVYEGWRFDQQSFPADLLHRGMATEKDGKLKLLVDDYSYAEDGILVWDAMLKFAKAYLSLYYDDNKNGQKVTDDVEIRNWWESVQKEGHPDISVGWPKIDSIDSLANVAATIMWTASAHHAAVNFGQYDNAAFVPHRPSKIRKKIPVPDTPEEKILRDRFEQEFFHTVSDTFTILMVMGTVQILSAHASDEEYLDKDGHNFIKDAEGAKVHAQFVADLQKAEAIMQTRNEESKGRVANGRGMPYTLLMPSLGGADPHPRADVRPPARGIPYSISI